MLAPALALLALWIPQQSDPLNRLASWVSRARIAPGSVDEKRREDLRAILGDLRLLRASGEGDTGELDRGLIELASLESRATPSAPDLLASARLGRAELEAELARANQALAARLAFEVLDPAARKPRAERVLAAQLLERARVPAILPVLRGVARESDPELARAAMAALCGWAEAGAHLFFLEQLERGAPGARLAAEHFERTRATLELPVLERLTHEVARRYLAEDWREAARARALVRAFEPPRAVPILIEALATWVRRTNAGTGSKRIRGELLAELQRLSGRAIGAEPARWAEWWEGVRTGRIALPSDIAATGGQSSSATFFGLHAATDRVVFVVDRSGSMKAALGTDGRSRHAEAIEQLLRFLRQSGEDTRFSLALFSAEGVTWRTQLSPATATNLEQARRWLEQKPPEGETRLFEGLRAGLELDSRGRIPLERCEADTVIVLCDGATSEGPGWIQRWLEEENERAQLVFHCVQIGGGGDGTLEALAKGSGGEFVRVQS